MITNRFLEGRELALTKKKYTLLNMVVMGIYQIVTVAVGFIVPKLLLSTYGAEIHGYTSTVSTIMSYIALLNAGLASAALQSLYTPLAHRDNREISRTLKAIDRMYVKTGIFYIIAVVGCAFVLPFVISGDISRVEIFGLMIIMGASNTMECFIYSKYRVLLQADQKLYIVTIGDIAALIVRCVLQVFFINNSSSIILVQAVPLMMVFLRMAIVSGYSKRYYNIDIKAEPNYNALSKRRAAFVHQIAALVVNNTDTMILTFLSSLVQVSVYSVYNLVCYHINTLLSYTFQQSVVASFGHMLSEGKEERINKFFRTYEFIYMVVITIIFSSTASLLYPFVKLYTSSMDDIQYAVWLYTGLFVAVGVANNVRVPCLMLINASGMFKETQIQAVIEAVLNLTISLCLVKPLGIAGLLIGTLISFLYRTTDIISFTNRYILKTSSVKSFSRAMRVVLIVAINFILCSNIIDIDAIGSWTEWVISGFKITLIGIGITLFVNFIFEKSEMKNAKKLLFG